MADTELHRGIPGVESWPAAHIELRPIAELVPYPRNARTHSAEQVEQIAAAMRQFGWTVPVLVDEEGLIIAGHGRLMAAQALGLTRIPTMTARGWSETQKQAYCLMDNQLALNAGWDPDLLRAELQGLEASGFEMDLLAFSPGDLSLAMFEPDFQPGDMDAQPRLDERKKATCPECGNVFDPA
jgi:ParB-like chromosome segregation protein Spo0J